MTSPFRTTVPSFRTLMMISPACRSVFSACSADGTEMSMSRSKRANCQVTMKKMSSWKTTSIIGASSSSAAC
jgi:hypothetical protein